MPTERIDVLAVLNTAERSIIGAGYSEFRPAMREAIAAVAGLIEAAKLSADQAARIRCNCCGSDEEGAEIAERLRSALGRIGG